MGAVEIAQTAAPDCQTYCRLCDWMKNGASVCHSAILQATWTDEIGVIKGQCLDRRIESCRRLIAEIDAWQARRNQSGACVAWMFSTDKARTKMARAYPNPSLKES